jgi:glucokinase
MIEQDTTNPDPSEPGRSARALSIDLGATRLRAAAISAAGEVVARRETPTPADGSPRSLVGLVIDVLSAVAADLPEDARDGLAGIGVSAVGPLDAERGVLLGPPNLGAGYRGLELAAPLRRHFGLPVAVERDTNVAALAERAFGAARDCDDFLYVTVSTGIGGGVFSAGRLLGGAGGFAGELGHVPVGLDGPACGCGQPGHLEAYASGTGIARRAREAGLGEVDAAAVVAAADAGDATAAAIVAEAIEAFAAAALGFVNAFDPELIVVGGGVADGLGERLLEPARRKVASFALAPPAREARILAAALGEDTSLVGCLPLLSERVPPTGGGAEPRLGARMEA